MIHNQLNVEPNEKILFKNRKTISYIYMNNDFYYNSFVVCRKLMEIESKFYCVSCSKEVEYLKLRYMLKVLATDETGSAWLVLFDKEVEKVIGHDIETVVELYLKDGWASNTLKLMMNDLITH
ncbi:hypothetical protein M9H77_21909 [Catharanthus roseus]|uniref:Uncharacterized protein n=1 Tax=Catharanthus roseus TaxID=4058 RepID=A0ACC0APP5_CATRO|nr:hypothetical protein M9H77_21909 [Catharanthus roseus]